MAVDRSKVLKAAQKHLAKGQLDKAIAEYEQLVADDPNDARLLLKLGDAYTKNGQLKQAADAYRKVADQYAEQGFFLKAVAVFKQILKLDPSRLDAWEKLAEMYELLSLVSDALSTYEKVADAYSRAGKTTRAVDALGKMAQLDPDNVAATIKYAEALSKVHRKEDAAEAFLRGASTLRRQGRMDDYIKVGERLLFHQPHHLDLARELAALYLDRQDAKHALAKLQMCFKADPRDVDTLQMLAASFELLGQNGKAISVYREMSRILGEQGEPARQIATLQKLLAIDPEHAEARQWLSELGVAPGQAATTEESVPIIDVSDEDDEDEDDIIVLDDDDSGVMPLGDDSHQSGARNLPASDQPGSAAQADDRDLQAQVDQMMSECEVFRRYQLHDKMETQLQTVLSLMPTHLEARIKLAEHYVEVGRPTEAAEHYDEAARTPGIDPAYARQYQVLAAELDPGTSDFSRLDRSPTSAPPMLDEAPTSELRNPRGQIAEGPDDEEVIFLDDEENDDLVLNEEPLEAVAPGDQAAFPGGDEAPTAEMDRARIDDFDDDLIFDDPVMANQPPPEIDAEASFFGKLNELEPAPVATAEGREGITDEVLFAADDDEADAVIDSGPPLDEDLDEDLDGDLDADFEFVEGDAGPEMVIEEASDADAELIAAIASEAAQQVSAPPEDTPISEVVTRSQAPAQIVAAEAEALAAEEIPEEIQEAIEEADFYLQQGLADEAVEALEDALEGNPSHPALVAKLAEIKGAVSAPPAAAPPAYEAEEHDEAEVTGLDDDQSFALAATLAEEAGSADVAPATPAGGPANGAASADVPVADVIQQFRAGVEKAVDRNDAATHYDLGIAYVEMGLHQEAIGEFKLCLEDPSRRCQANTMIGLSYLSEGTMDRAVEHFEAALTCEPSDAERLELWFELGNTYELSEKHDEALEHYRRVAAQDSEYRDVQARIERLEAAATPKDEDDEFDAMFDNMILKD